MNIRIILKDVGNGDCIFVMVQRADQKIIIVIDGGRERDADDAILTLDQLLLDHGKQYPDLIIGTHFDNDHIAGLLPILRHYNNPRIVLWMFDTQNMLTNSINPKVNQKTTFGIFPSINDSLIGSKNRSIQYLSEQNVIRSIKKEQQILSYARALGMPIHEPIAGECVFPGWPEIEIIGPTSQFYQTLFPSHKADVRQISQEALKAENERNDRIECADPCSKFSLERSPITRVNLLSAIIRINVNGKFYLFTGDAGIDSFDAIPEKELILAGIYCLKLPHHGSAANINNRLLELMRPETVLISGGSRIDQTLVACLEKRGSTVITTKTGDILHVD